MTGRLFKVLSDRLNRLRRVTGGSTSCGWMFDEVSFMIYALVKLFRPHLVIQTGHLWGKSALVILEALNDDLFSKEHFEDQDQRADLDFSNFVRKHEPEIPQHAQFVSIDPDPTGVPNLNEGIDLLREWYDNFTFYKMTSNDFFRQKLQQFQLLYSGKRIMGIVDGDHSVQGCYADLENLSKLKAGLIIIDDTIWIPHLGDLARSFAKKKKYQCLNIALWNGIAILFEKSSFESRFKQLFI